MIARHWHGFTTLANADAFEAFLRAEVDDIVGRKIPGFLSIELLRRDGGSETEFVTIMRFNAPSDVRAFAGDDLEAAVVPPEARALLARFDERSAHYEVLTLKG